MKVKKLINIFSTILLFYFFIENIKKPKNQKTKIFIFALFLIMLASVGIGQETQYEYKTYTGLGCGECPGGEEWNCGVHASWRDGTASECQVPEGEETGIYFSDRR